MSTRPGVRCAYMYNGQQCVHPPVDARLLPLNARDNLVVLMCEPHCVAYDAIQWAHRKRASLEG